MEMADLIFIESFHRTNPKSGIQITPSQSSA